MKHLLILALLLTSCRSAQWHFEKAQSKGLTLETTIETRTIQKIDTIRDVMTNEILRIDTLYQTVTETRTEPRFISLTRQERKAILDSLKHVENMYKLENARLKREIALLNKLNKRENKTERVIKRQEEKTERIDKVAWIVTIAFAGLLLIAFMLYFLPRLIRNKLR